MKDLNTKQIAAIKRQFKNSLPLLKKLESVNKKLAALEEEKKELQDTISCFESGIITMTGGYRSFDLINCEYVPQFNEDGTPKMDKDNKYQLKTQVLTFIPPVEAIEGEPVCTEVVKEVNIDNEVESAPQVDDSFPFDE